MRFTATILAALSGAALVSADTCTDAVATIPSCFAQYISTMSGLVKCSDPKDFKCICASEDLAVQYLKAIGAHCDAVDADALPGAVDAVCAACT